MNELATNVFGLPVVFVSDDPHALDFSRMLAMELGVLATLETSVEPLVIRIVVKDEDIDDVDDYKLHFIEGGNGALRIEGGGISARVDPLRREGEIVSGRLATLEARDARNAAIEAVMLALVSCFDRHPVHASAIVAKGRAILFAGASGAGKSTLAHRAHLDGFGFLSEDIVRIQLDPALRIWGGPAFVHLAQASESVKQRIPLERQTPAFAETATVCVLARGDHARLEPITAGVVRASLDEQLAPGFDRFPWRHDAVMDALACNGGWRLTLGADPDDAMDVLRPLLEYHDQ